MDKNIYYDELKTEFGTLYIAADDKGLVFVSRFASDGSDLTEWCRKKGAVNCTKDSSKMKSYMEPFSDYFQGNVQTFDIPISLHGSDFQIKVWKALCDIRYGETNTYSEIAEKIGCPKAFRAVGKAIGENPILIVIPCHRVISKNGKLTGYRGGVEMKKILLELEKRPLSR